MPHMVSLMVLVYGSCSLMYVGEPLAIGADLAVVVEAAVVARSSAKRSLWYYWSYLCVVSTRILFVVE